MKSVFYFLQVLFLFFHITMDSKSIASSAIPDMSSFSTTITTQENSVQWFVREKITELENSPYIKIEGHKIIGNKYIIDIYTSMDFQPIWTSSKNTDDLLTILENSYYEGLNPDDYYVDFIRNYLESSKNPEPQAIAAADIIMTDAILSYAFHMIQGKVHPTDLDPNWNYTERPMPDDVEFRLLYRLETNTLKKGAVVIRPEIPMYDELRTRFALLDSIKKAGGDIQPLEYPGKALRSGDTSPAVAALKDHMMKYGFQFSNPEKDRFEHELEEAIKDFQMFNGLETDGICGKATYKALNVNLEERLDIVRVNMERCRWINNDLPEEFLLVNIADYNLYIFRNREIDYNCRVVVGKEFHETPVFTSDIKYVVFNPTWTVPYSIASKEMLPKLKKDLNYLQNRNMTLLRGNEVVNPSTVDFRQYSQKNFPFTIRQEPGPNNALGLVKFIFPNKYSVYLHDTPSKSYFEKTDRAFSHGCVRVKDPLILAEELLADRGYDSEKIGEIIKSKETLNVSLSKSLPVMIMYWTCYVNTKDNHIYFFQDVYGRDKKIIKELNRAR